MSGKRNHTSVLIVGAGPTGLVMALWLKKRGINFRIIDKSSGPGQTSRALAVQARTLEFYQQLGIADQLIQAGVAVPQLVLRRRGKAVATAKFGALGEGVSPFPYLLFCSQDVHEALLCDVLKTLGVEIERQTELVELVQEPHQVTVRTKSPQGEEVVTADYVCGSDGAHSAVRKQMPTDFPGGTYQQVFYVADVLATGEAAQGGVQISVSRQDFCIVMPIKSQGSIRLTGLVPTQSEQKEKITFDDVADSVRHNTGLNVKQVNWFSSYHVHHRVADRFQMGRVFIAGDAGHIHSPAGGQGMNTGIGDAINLAWKLSDVLRGRCSEKILESYEVERRAFAKVLIRTTDQAFKVIASRSLLGSLFRAYLLAPIFAGLTRLKPVLNLMFRTVSQIRIHYRKSFLSRGTAGEIHAGDRLPWIKTDQCDNFEPLRSLDWQVHVYGQATNELKDSLMGNLSLYEFSWNEIMTEKGFMKDAMYLIRPDGHVALAAAKQDAQAVNNYFRFELL